MKTPISVLLIAILYWMVIYAMSIVPQLSDTLVVLTSEFGRTPNINGRDGRDHCEACKLLKILSLHQDYLLLFFSLKSSRIDRET